MSQLDYYYFIFQILLLIIKLTFNLKKIYTVKTYYQNKINLLTKQNKKR